MSEPERAAFFHDFGAAVARLHAVDVGYFAEDFASAARAESWASIVESRLDRLTDAHRQAALRAAARAVSPTVRPAFVHRDLYRPNTLVSDGRFRCLLDFEHARSSDALSDFAKLKMWVFDEVPGSEARFCAGYGGDSRSSPGCSTGRPWDSPTCSRTIGDASGCG